MIDTMIVQYQCRNNAEYNEFYNHLDNLLKAYRLEPIHKDKKTKRHYITTAWKNDGFRKIDFHPTRNGFKHLLEIELQPIRLLQYNEHVDLADFEQYHAIAEKFNAHIAQLFGYLSALPDNLKFENWKVKRIDYAFNLHTPYVGAYIRLLHRGRTPRNYQRKAYDTSIYFHAKSKRYNFYDKHSHLLSKGDKVSMEELHRAEGILRFEVQCEKKSVEKLKDQFKLEDMSVISLWNKNIARHVLHCAIESVFDEQAFYRIDIVREKLLQDQNTADCLSVVRTIADAPTLDDAKFMYFKKHSDCKNPNKKYSRRLKQIQNIGVNPLTLPVDCGLPESVTWLSNPCHHEFFDASKDAIT